MTAHHDVLQRGHAAKEADVLERACDAVTRHRMRLQSFNTMAVKYQGAGVGHGEPGQHVEQRGFAGAVGPDQAENFAAPDSNRHVG